MVGRTVPALVAGRELLVVAAAVATVVLAVIPGDGASRGVHEVLTLTTAAVGTAAAILADLAARIRDLPRVAWSGAAFAVYSLLIIPSTALETDSPGADVGLVATRLIAYVVVLVLLLLAVRQSRRGGAWGGWVIAGGGTVVALAVGQALSLAPDGLIRVVLPESLSLVALVGWCWVAVVYLQQGIRLNRPPLWRIGIGVGVLAGAQMYRIISGTDLAQPNPGFAALRLLGLVVVLVAVAGFWVFVVRGLRDDQERQTEELRIATEHLERAAESAARRDHELRNGIGGLAGITALLSAPEDERNGPLRAAVLAELGRLSRMVDSGMTDDETTCDVDAVLHETAMLHRARGADVAVEVPDGVRAEVPHDVLRQVLLNVLVNAERHAPGAAVELRAWREGTIVVVEVRDHGPGVPAGREEAVFAPGVRSDETGGSGLGLHISRELVAEHGGTMTIRPADLRRPGCAVVLTFMGSSPLPTTANDFDLAHTRQR